MEAVRVALLRDVLAGTEWLQATRRFAGALRSSVTPQGGLLLVGGETYEPWHLAAHLDDEAAWSGLPELSPTLVRHRVPAGSPAHLAVSTERLAAAGRGDTLLVVSPGAPGCWSGSTTRGAAAPRCWRWTAGTTSCTRWRTRRWRRRRRRRAAPTPRPLDLETVQHLVSAAAGENGRPAPRGRRRFRDRLSRLADALTSPPPPRW